MKTKSTKTFLPLQPTVAAKKTKRLAGIIGFGLCCGFLVGPPGCAAPGKLPHPPGLSAPNAPQLISALTVDPARIEVGSSTEGKG
jgi:hypothetical protein